MTLLDLLTAGTITLTEAEAHEFAEFCISETQKVAYVVPMIKDYLNNVTCGPREANDIAWACAIAISRRLGPDSFNVVRDAQNAKLAGIFLS